MEMEVGVLGSTWRACSWGWNLPEPQIPHQAGLILICPLPQVGSAISSSRKSFLPWKRSAFIVPLAFGAGVFSTARVWPVSTVAVVRVAIFEEALNGKGRTCGCSTAGGWGKMIAYSDKRS